ncbi:hypothetical protein ACTFIV_007212 [Dictyostelium citrinum]
MQPKQKINDTNLNNNQITGTIDESWCFNNWLSGPLPDCKYCYKMIHCIGHIILVINLPITIQISNTILYNIESNNGKEFTFAGNQFTVSKDSFKLSLSVSNWNYKKNVNYLKISKSGKTLYGRFQDKMLSDGRSTITITKIISKDDKKVVISLDMPHCNQCLLNPDFSVIINSDFKSSDLCGKQNKKPWLIPVAVTVPVVGCALIIFSFLLRI